MTGALLEVGAATGILWRRDVLNFLRRPGRIAAALGQPVLLWVLLGSGLGSAFRFGDQGYLAFFFPGTIFLVVLFSTIFSTISVIEDRQRGFLRAVLASPVPRPALVLGKALGAATLAVAQGAAVLVLSPMVGLAPTAAGLASAVGLLFLYAVALSALGWSLAWLSTTTAGYHAAMNSLLLPMWLLSGAVFPAAKVPPWMALLLSVNPLTYGLAGLRAALSPVLGPVEPWPWVVGLAFAASTGLLALLVTRRAADRR